MKAVRIAVGIACFIVLAWAADSSPAQVRQAATKAVAIIQKSQQNWYAKQSCTSCHQQIYPALAFQAAREHGVFVDERAARADAAQAFSFYSRLDQAVEYTGVIDPALNDGYLLVAANAAGVRPSITTAVYARLIAARQEPEGNWDTFDERPPESYSRFTATAISLRAIQLYGHASQKADIQARVSRAQAWLLSHAPRATEERVFQLLGLHWAGAEQLTLTRMAEQLKASQQDDGGWSSLDGRPSDAYSTGQALIALHDAGGVPVSNSSWKRGIDYLVRTQAPDGTWHVQSRLHPPAPVSPPYFESGHPYGHDQFISMMGDCLAVMALSTALGPSQSSSQVLAEAEPVGTELTSEPRTRGTERPVRSWVETLLFGSVEDVKKLLDSGFDANSATKSGGVTALMLATPDVEKMKLLLEHGANADARSRHKFSALLVAAQYPGSSAAMNLLLDHGAKVRMPPGQGAPFFNAFPIILASMSGNSEIIGRLVQEGDRINDKMNLVGIIPVTPMMALATTHRSGTVSALLDAGAKADEVDGQGITSLSWAAIANRTDMARLLIGRGADVNHVDKKGMTPLLYAASIDFGDSAMVDLLLQSGANRNARTPEGLTAFDLAHKYKHTHLLASLETPQASR